ncbi:MAG TPA: hydantoinase/oxoprolinase family protein [Ktedonobacteraceae bacterium]|nr:hydantoinase/oxoprolinase family protein [Ktedonobacteraceae bacterium]
MYTVDIDVGGTLTDGLFSDGKTAIPIKVDTTPHDLTVCFQDCLTEGAHHLGFDDLTEFMNQVDLIRWSTTITSNALAQRTGPKLGLLVSAGHEHDLYANDSADTVLGTLVAPANVIGISRPIDPKTVLLAVKTLLENGVRRICISLDGSFEDASDEQEAKRAIESQYPDHFLGTVPVLLGSDLSHYPDTATRTNHSLINAYIHGPLASALYKAEDDLRASGYEHPLLIGHANGGVSRVSKTKALDTLESGPTMGLFAAAYFARAYQIAQVVTLDVGGTTSKVGINRDGRVEMTNDADILGIPINAPTVMLHSIALGGGSVVTADQTTRRLRLGPESMGAYPGPACYDLGGSEPTVTDAFLTLQWLPADYFLGGSRKLNTERAREVIEQHIAKPLGKSVEQAALDIASSAFQMVADTMREVLERVGWRAEDSTLFTFGGNGPAFACGVAERLGISQVYMFNLGAVFSAFGSSISDIVHVYEHGLKASLSAEEGKREIREVIERMRTEALHDMKGEGFSPERVKLSLEAEVAGTDGTLTAVYEDLSSTTDGEPTFLGTHEGIVELLRLRAIATMAHYEATRQASDGHSPNEAIKGHRDAIWGRVSDRATLFTWEALQPGNEISGGAILESAWTTYPVLPGWVMRIDEYGNGHLQRR